MNKILLHILEFSIILSVIYLLYRLLIYQERYHKLNRFFLIIIPFIAMTITLTNVDVSTNLSAYYGEMISPGTEPQEISAASPVKIPQTYSVQREEQNNVVIENKTAHPVPYFLLFLCLAGSILLIRLLVQNLKLAWLIRTSVVRQSGKLRLVEVSNEISPFSYFRYVFINCKQISSSELKNILSHEHVHYLQKHSWDNLFLELIGLFQWFNPFYWLLRASLKETHEYLADEGVLEFGTDRTDYQVLLLNQVAEGPLMAIACNFSKSLTKKRIIMMQKAKKSLQRTITKLFFILPVIMMLAMIFSCNIQTGQKEKHITAISPTKMNVLYLGVDNPLAVAVSGVPSEQIVVETDNGKIEGKQGLYVVRPEKTGTAKIKVYQVKKDKNELLKESVFRVKTVPDPVAMIAGRKGGTITKEELLKANEVQVVLQNFDFDLSFRVTQFTIVLVVNGYMKQVSSDDRQITEEQKDLFRSLKAGDPVYIQDIKAIGPDGAIRLLNTISLKIQE